MDGKWMEGHTSKRKLTRGHIGANELFRDIEITTNFYKGIQVKTQKFREGVVALLLMGLHNYWAFKCLFSSKKFKHQIEYLDTYVEY